MSVVPKLPMPARWLPAVFVWRRCRARGSGQWQGYSKSLPGEIVQPRVDYGALVSGYLFNEHAHAENAQAATGMQVDHLALQFACPHVVRDAQAKFRPNGNGHKRTHITTSRAQFGNLCAN